MAEGFINAYPVENYESFITFNPENHTYTTKDGKVLISVTQLLKKHSLSPSFEDVPVDVLRRAAERGTAIHAEFEEIIKTKGNCVVFSNEANWFLENLYDPEDKWFSEVLVYTTGYETDYAGTIDIIRFTRDGRIIIYDIKTGKVHMDAVAWQTSLYRVAFAQRQVISFDLIELAVIDAKEDGCKVIPVHPVSYDEILRLIDFESQGIPYTPGDLILSPASLAKVDEFEKALMALEEEKKKIISAYDSFQTSLMDAMLNNGVKTFDTPNFKVTFVASSISTQFDSARFKAENADLYEQYKTKTVSRKAYLKVTAK